MPVPSRLKHYAPRLGLAVAALAGIGVVAALLPRFASPYWLQVLVFMGCNVIAVVSLNLVNGYAGQFSLGHAGFMAIGAYTSAKISLTLGAPWLAQFPAGAPAIAAHAGYLLAAMLVAGLAAALGGLLVGLPSLRLRGDYLAIATLGFGEIIRVVLLNVDAVGGARGLAGIPKLTSPFVVMAVALGTIVAVQNLMRSVHGRAILAIREDETAAESLGISCAHYKTAAFVIGAFFAGVAGCLYAHQLQFIHPRGFDFMKSVELVLMVVLGGGSSWGAALAAVVVTVLPEGLRVVKDALHLPVDPRMVIYSALLIAVMLLRRGSLSGTRRSRRAPRATEGGGASG